MSDAPIAAADEALAAEIASAYADRRAIDPPSSRAGGFDLARAYAVERALARMRRAQGHAIAGLKVGYANRAMWRVLKLDTLVWGHMYDDTVHFARGADATLSVGRMVSPKIEPEIVFKMKRALDASLDGPSVDAAAALDAVEWIAIGFEIIDCVYPDWKFQPVDFVAAYGLHAALIVGQPASVAADAIPQLVDALPQIKIALRKNGELVAEGSGKNSLRSPALCLAELASALARQSSGESLAAGSLVSSGTLTESQPLGANETWRVDVDGWDLAPLTLTTTA
jgi:2-oxo-3-hexenedioate decarboxylase